MVVVVAVGAHPDDVEGGCFGALSKFKKAGNEIVIITLTKGGRKGDTAVREQEAKAAAAVIDAKLILGEFNDGELNDDSKVVTWIEHQLKSVNADIVFAPCFNDRHQDHRNVGRAAISATRYVSNVLMYETCTTTDFKLEMFVDITDELKDKVAALGKHKSQQKKEYLPGEIATNLAKYRAYQMRIYGKAAEVFQVVRWELKI